MEKWSDGIYLLGRYNQLQTGCWLLLSHGQGAVLEMPPFGDKESGPLRKCVDSVAKKNIEVKYLLASHCHWDHISRRALAGFLKAFPNSRACLQRAFYPYIGTSPRTCFFNDAKTLEIGGEPLHLIYAPKHSLSDTMIAFKGVMFTGDWELNTIYSVNDKGADAVPKRDKLKSIEHMSRFEEKYNYHIHKVFSTHANDRRENVDFKNLMLDTKKRRKLLA